MFILVTGGGGFVGRAVVRALHGKGHRVRLLRRRASVTSPAGTGPVSEVVTGDALDPEVVTRAATGVDAVIHLVGIISEVGRNTFENAHTATTSNIVAACRQAGVRRLVHMSALGTRPEARSRYHQSKWAAEELVRGSGLDWTIFRPSLIYGADDHLVAMLATISRWSPLVPVMGSGTGLLQPVAVEAVAVAFLGALNESRSVGLTLDLCGPDRLSFKAVTRAILRALGRRRFLLRVPMPVARAAALTLEAVFPRLFRQAPPLNRDQLLMLEEDNVGDPAPATELFDLRLEQFEDGLRRCLARGRPGG